MTEKETIDWLSDGDVAVRYQTCRDLLGKNRPDLRRRISKEGWGAKFLSMRGANGHWGRGFYQPKWISSHYTLLDLRHLELDPEQRLVKETIRTIAAEEKSEDGGVNPAKTVEQSDVCVNGMFLTYACYFGEPEEELKSVVDFILTQRMADGGFNCRSNYSGAVHSSLHTTVSVAEGFFEYKLRGYGYRVDETEAARRGCDEFMLMHRLYKSDKTGGIIDKKMTMLSFPSRWRYDILRALDYFRFSGTGYDRRMEDALELLRSKRRKDGAWPVQAKHPGKVHFDMEETGAPSRWNTLRALRVLRHFDVDGRTGP